MRSICSYMGNDITICNIWRTSIGWLHNDCDSHYCCTQHSSLLLQLQLLGSCKQFEQMSAPQPIHVLSTLLHPQCLHRLIELYIQYDDCFIYYIWLVG